MYRFELQSVDGTSELDVDDLNEFANDWLSGSFVSLYRDGDYVTPDGITAITPSNQITREAVEQKAIAEALHSSLDMSSQNFLDASLAMDKDKVLSLVAASMLSKGNERYADTKFGRTFVVDEGSHFVDKFMPSKATLEDNFLQQGSLYLKDTLVVKDSLSKKVFITDTRGEALSLEDMLPRQVEKGIVVDASFASFGGFNDDGVYADIKVAGDHSKVHEIESKLKKMEAEFEPNISVLTRGYNNGPNNPLSQEDLVKLSYNHSGASLEEKGGTHRVRKLIVSPKLANQAGSTEKGIWVKGVDGLTTYLHGGSAIYTGYKKEDLEGDVRNVMWAKEVAMTSSEFDESSYQPCEKTKHDLSFEEVLGYSR